MISYNTQMMENLAPQTVVGAQEKFEVILNSNQTAALLAIGTDKVLRLLSPSDSSSTWSEVQLSKTGEEVSTFAVTQKAGTTYIAYSSIQKGPAFYSAQVTDLSSLEESSFSSYKLPSSITSKSAINDIIVDSQGAIFAVETPNADATYYSVDYGSDVASYELPQNGIVIQGMDLASVNGFRGVIMLYEVGGSQTLIFVSFPQAAYGGKEFKIRYDFGDSTLSTIATFDNQGGDTQLLAAGNEIYYFSDAQSKTTVYQASSGSTITEIQASVTGNNVSLFVNIESSGQQKNLSLITGSSSESGGSLKWNPPILIQKNVSQFAGVYINGEIENQLFYTSPQGLMNYLYQCNSTKLWRSSAVFLPATGTFRDFNSYNAVISFDLSDMEEESNPIVTLTASYFTQINIGGAQYNIGPKTPLQLALTQSELNISYELSNILDLLLYIEGSFLDGTQTVDLASGFCTALQGLNTPDLLRKAPVIGPLISKNPKLTDQSLDNFISGISTLLKFRSYLIKHQGSGDFSQITPLPPSKSMPVLDTDTEEETALILEEELEIGDILGPVGDLIAIGAIILTLVFLFEDDGSHSKKPAYVRVYFKQKNDSGELVVQIGSKEGVFEITEPGQVIPLIQMMFSNIGVSTPDLTSWDAYGFDYNEIAETTDSLEATINNMISNADKGFQDPSVFSGQESILQQSYSSISELNKTLSSMVEEEEEEEEEQTRSTPCKYPVSSWFELNLATYDAPGILFSEPTPAEATTGLDALTTAVNSLSSSFPDVQQLYEIFEGKENVTDFGELLSDEWASKIIDFEKQIGEAWTSTGTGANLSKSLDQTLVNIPFLDAINKKTSSKPLTMARFYALNLAFQIVPYCRATSLQNPFTSEFSSLVQKRSDTGSLSSLLPAAISILRLVRACPTFPRSRGRIKGVLARSNPSRDMIIGAYRWFTLDCAVRALTGELAYLQSVSKEEAQTVQDIKQGISLIYIFFLAVSNYNFWAISQNAVTAATSKANLKMLAQNNASAVFMLSFLSLGMILYNKKEKKPLPVGAVPIFLFQFLSFPGSTYMQLLSTQAQTAIRSLFDYISARRILLFVAGVEGLLNLDEEEGAEMVEAQMPQ